jgi:hypothetical protein
MEETSPMALARTKTPKTPLTTTSVCRARVRPSLSSEKRPLRRRPVSLLIQPLAFAETAVVTQMGELRGS